MPVARRSPPPPVPFWQTTDGETVRLYQGNATDVLARLPAKSVHCVVTSPPYWGLRDYQTGVWTGGETECDHIQVESGWTNTSTLGPKKDGLGPTNAAHLASRRQIAAECGKCGAVRNDEQTGSEAQPDCGAWASGGNCAEGDGWRDGCHVCRMVTVFREVRRVLRDDGVLWLNYGDTYASGNCGGESVFANGRTDGKPGDGGIARPRDTRSSMTTRGSRGERSGLPPGNLVGVPWRVALALQADGWVLRSDIPWVKRSSMPESVTNRPAKSLEYVFLLTKRGSGYFYDADAVRRPQKEFIESAPGPKANKGSTVEGDSQIGGFAHKDGGFNKAREEKGIAYNPLGRNFRNADLWFESVDGPHGLVGVRDEVVGIDVTSESYSGAHFAAFGSRLITPFILAGTSAKGCCAKCGAPWRRVTDRAPFAGPSDGRSSGVGGQPDQGKARLRKNGVSARDESGLSAVGKGPNRNGKGESTLDSTIPTSETVGWEPTCTCYGRFEKRTSMIRYYGSWTSREEREHGNVAWKDGDLPAQAREEVVNIYVSDLPLDQHPVIPCTVLDPFIGSGTTCAVAVTHGRRGVGIDLSEKYLRENAVVRIKGVLIGRPALVHLVPRVAEVPRTRGTDLLGGK